VELPFDDDEVAPLQADDPRPQRVPQFPAGPRRTPRRGSSRGSREGRDRELPARYDSGEYEDPGHSPIFLYVERGPGAGQLVPVKQGLLIIGRASTSDLRLQHPSISRRHAQLTRRQDRLFLTDLGSQNGTFVNRERLSSELEIHSGDELALGNALLRVRGPAVTGESPAPEVSPPVASRRRATGSRRRALLAAALGALVAVFLALAGARVLRSRTEPSTPGETVGAVPPEASPVATSATASQEEPEPPPTVRAETPPQAAPASGGQAQRTSGTPALSAQAIAEATGKVSAPRQREVAGPRAAAATPSAQLSPEEAEAEALSRFEAGDVEAALDLARRAHLETLSTTLARFQEEWKAGHAALTARDSAAAIQHLSLALELDHALSKGWSTYGPRIRKALEQAQLQTGGGQRNER
jgi:hypothetical protein